MSHDFASLSAPARWSGPARRAAALALWAAAALGCGMFGPGGRYHRRDPSCAVTTLDAAPAAPHDDLGIVSVDCWAGDEAGCKELFLDEVCRRGGDVVWGLGDPAPSTSKLTAHVGRRR